MNSISTGTTSTWRFHPLDTLFFRESRPHSPVGAAILSSVFPPSPRTVMGAVRFLIGEGLGVDWRQLGGAGADSPEGRFQTQVGDGKSYGRLQITGPWLAFRRGETWERLYPAPRSLASRQGEGPEVELRAFHLGEPVDCDLGRLRLPKLPDRGWKGVEDGWLTARGWAALLRGEIPGGKEWIRPDTLVREEPRMGIVRDPRRGSAVKGLLYQTRHLRLPAVLREAEEVAVEVTLGGIDRDLLAPALRAVRLGGEGRLATVETVGTVAGDTFLPAPSPVEGMRGLILHLLTPADLAPGESGSQEGGWLLPRRGGATDAWQGELRDLRITVRSAILGKPMREGGWDLVRNAPRRVRSLVPAGSAWYCTVEGADLTEAIGRLHGHRIGSETALGRGCLAVGLWNDQHADTRETAS